MNKFQTIRALTKLIARAHVQVADVTWVRYPNLWRCFHNHLSDKNNYLERCPVDYEKHSGSALYVQRIVSKVNGIAVVSFTDSSSMP